MVEMKNGAVGAEEALPMQKASPVAFVVAGLAVAVIGGLVVFAMSGDDKSTKVEKAAATEKAADAKQGMTKAELEEQQAHLKRTQTAMIAAAAEEEQAKRAQQQAEAQRKAAEQEAAAESAQKTSTAPKKKVNSQKSIQGLDALGADITSALE